jgi:hypothetical protein
MTEKEFMEELLNIRFVVWLRDISNPTTPEYIEYHKKIREILSYIDTVIEKTEKRCEE